MFDNKTKCGEFNNWDNNYKAKWRNNWGFKIVIQIVIIFETYK